MAASDNLSPKQFSTTFDPATADYTGTAYHFSKQDSSGTSRVTTGGAQLSGRLAAYHAITRGPTGATTDFQLQGGLGPAGTNPGDWGKFLPNSGQTEPN